MSEPKLEQSENSRKISMSSLAEAVGSTTEDPAPTVNSRSLKSTTEPIRFAETAARAGRRQKRGSGGRGRSALCAWPAGQRPAGRSKVITSCRE